MDIGLGMAVRNHPDRPEPLPAVYRDYLDDAVYAEELGFDHVWVGEHRMTRDQWTPSPLVTLGAIAARTSTIRLGAGVLCLPFHNPLRVAEDVAVLDNISNGRASVGFGVGSQYEEFRTFGINPVDRLPMTYEAAGFIRRCFTETDTFSHHGTYYRFDEVTFTQRPAQQQIPFYASAMGPKSIARAAADGYFLLAPRQPAYDEALRAAGRDPADFDAITMQNVCVAATHDRAVEASLDGLHYAINFYALRRDVNGNLPDPRTAEFSREHIAGGKPSTMGIPAIGTPDEVTEMLRGHGGSVTVREVRTGERHEVDERTAGYPLQSGQLVCARVVPDGAGMRFFGLEPVSVRERDPLIALINTGPDPVELVAQLSSSTRGVDGPQAAC